jgi:hypothetical protein
MAAPRFARGESIADRVRLKHSETALALGTALSEACKGEKEI